MAAAMGFGAVLGIRPLAGGDLGYHLSYGDAFWDEGRLVDCNNDLLFTLEPYLRASSRPPEPGPGCWYDQQGRYRFPNANWLSQVAFAGVFRLVGPWGLCVLRLALVAGMLALSMLSLRNLHVSWPATAAAIVLIAMACYQRFDLRPELFGYLLLAGQLYLLTRGAGAPGVGRWRPSWPAVAGLVGLQLLLVNAHGYFLLGPAMTLAVLLDRALYLLWQRAGGGRREQPSGLLAQSVRRLTVALVAQIAVCFVNPWTWRVVALPFQTVLYLQRHHITSGPLEGPSFGPAPHPWAGIREFFPPFAGPLVHTKATYAYCVVLALAGAGGIAALLRRQWASVMILAGMVAVSLAMRRNISVAALLIVPVALGAAWPYASKLAGRFSAPLRRAAAAGASAVVLLGAIALIALVVTHQFYRRERLLYQCGMGVDELRLSLGPAEWIKRHKPVGRLWTDFNVSSNVHYFSGRRPVPILTNTWAYPPEMMRDVLRYVMGEAPFAAGPKDLAAQILVLQMPSPPRQPGFLAHLHELADNPAWRIVCVDWINVVFLRADGPNAELAVRSAVNEDSFDAAAYIRRIERNDPLPLASLYGGAETLMVIGFCRPAAAVLERYISYRPDSADAWYLLALCHVDRARKVGPDRDAEFRDELEEAGRCFHRVLRIDPNHDRARRHLGLLTGGWR